METFVFEPPAPSPRGLILAQHIPVGHTGLENDEFTLQTAARFAAAGFTVAVPFIFHWWRKNDDIAVKRDESDDRKMVLDVTAAFDFLARRPGIDPDHISVVGHCWGGRVAWLGACHLPVSACAIFYGGRIKLTMGASDVPPIDLADQIRCPVAGYFGNDDRNPTPADVDDYARALQASNVAHVFHRYDGAGHAFQNFPTPDRFVPEASEDAWTRVLDFLSRYG